MAQIDLDCVKHNFNFIKAHTKSKICCVVEANAYGHCAVRLSALYQELGVCSENFCKRRRIDRVKHFEYNTVFDITKKQGDN